MSLISQYMDLEVSAMEMKIDIMKSINNNRGFVSMVIEEFNLVSKLEVAFMNIEFIYKDLFGENRFNDFSDFLKLIL